MSKIISTSLFIIIVSTLLYATLSQASRPKFVTHASDQHLAVFEDDEVSGVDKVEDKCEGIENEEYLVISNNTWSLPILIQNQHLDADLINWICSFDHNTKLNPTTQDTITWNGTKEERVTARTIWIDLRSSAATVRWHPIIWNRMKIARYAFTAWIAMHERLPTLQRLSSYGINTNMQCFLCISAVESQEHLFMSCSFARYILCRLFDLITNATVPLSWSGMISFLLSLPVPHKDIAFLAFQIFIHYIWRERNRRAHDKGVCNPDNLLKIITLDLRSRVSTSTWFIRQSLKFPLLQLWLT